MGTLPKGGGAFAAAGKINCRIIVYICYITLKPCMLFTNAVIRVSVKAPTMKQ